jgi:hypothetical protein
MDEVDQVDMDVVQILINDTVSQSSSCSISVLEILLALVPGLTFLHCVIEEPTETPTSLHRSCPIVAMVH